MQKSRTERRRERRALAEAAHADNLSYWLQYSGQSVADIKAKVERYKSRNPLVERMGVNPAALDTVLAADLPDHAKMLIARAIQHYVCSGWPEGTA